ncbi:PREDICTED: RNA-directed DNA polymerase from mobile element jockey-like [Acropora digitifera]|uniref:RNA-directed DNA polymerase from mobile element jockey-like n=1 Tax=Acropora digitifera TaxID=70779 RepID=UPI00077A8012|nr:PREDICTED: RNA-directed DNA polymerase from mobile element jockey-like [Acropora digitifera]
MDPHCLNGITEKNNISKRQKASSTGNTFKYNFYRNKVRKLCKSARKFFYNSKILNTREPNTKKWWTNIKSISGLSKSEPLSSVFHNGEFKRGSELADLIAESFCNVSNSLPPHQFNKLPISSVPDEYIISPRQVEIELENISLQKATGPDDIPNWVLKSSALLLAGPITPVLSKLLEGFLFRWLLNHIKSSIDHLQFGNINNCSTTHALIHLIHHWLAEFDNPGSIIRCCMIDFSKAFDRIDHDILLHKIQLLNTPPNLLNWCADFLHDQYLRVKLGQHKSSCRSIHAGVPQGTKLGPLFFLVMINDLQTTLPLYKYVDNCTVYEIISSSSHNSTLQATIDSINNWTEHNNMCLNVFNTKELRVSFLKDPMAFDNLSSSDTSIETVHDFKLLGVIISSNLTWNVNYICTKASKRLYALRVLKRSGAPAKDLIIVYCAFIRPVLEYASPVWHFSFTQSLSDQIEHIQKRALKIVFPEDSYSTSLEMANLPTLYQRREHQCQTLYIYPPKV